MKRLLAPLALAATSVHAFLSFTTPLQHRGLPTAMMAVKAPVVAEKVILARSDELDEPDISSLPTEHYLDTQPMIFRKSNNTFVQELKFALKPRGRLPRHRVIDVKIEGSLPLASPASLSSTELSLTKLCSIFTTAAHDPRIDGILLEVGPLAASTAALQELRRHMDYFCQSRKDLMGYAPRTLTIDQLYVLGGCGMRIAVPEVYTDITGFSAEVDFLRGVFDEVGIEPQVQRIGAFKSFGDRFSRNNMSDAQRETLSSLLGSVSSHKLGQLARDANRTVAELETAIDAGELRTATQLEEFGLLDILAYEDEVLYLVRERQRKKRRENAPWWQTLFGQRSEQKRSGQAKRRAKIASNAAPASDVIVPLRQYAKAVSRLRIDAALGATGDKTVAVLVAEGGIVEKSGSSAGSGDLVVDKFRALVQRVIRDKSVSAVVVRIGSPGGDALASDLMWRLCRVMAESGKPVIASIGSVAASGGYYIAMGCDGIVAEEQSITGSIGVVLAKFSLEKLFKRVGYSVERLSRGRFAEVRAFERGFTPEEEQFFAEGALEAYDNFVSKAAASRDMTVDKMHRRAQGRVWTGWQGAGLGLVDKLGGLQTAVELARHESDKRDRITACVKRQLKEYNSDKKWKEAPVAAAAAAAAAAAGAGDVAAAAGDAVAAVAAAAGDVAAAVAAAAGDAAAAAPAEGSVAAAEAGGKEKDGEDKDQGENKGPDPGFEARAQLERWGLLGWEINSYADVRSLMEAGRANAAEEDLGELSYLWPLSEATQRALAVVLMKLQIAELKGQKRTKVKFFEPEINPLAVILRLLGAGGLQLGAAAQRGGGELDAAGGGVAAAAAAAAALARAGGTPLAVLDDTVGRAFPGISGVPEQYRQLGVGPVVWQLLQRTPEAEQLGKLVVEQLGKAITRR